MIKSFQDLSVYKLAKSLYPKVILLTRAFPQGGFHLRDQMCRAANSIQANIAEGFGRSASEFKMYLTRALGSSNELVSHLEDAENASFGNKKVIQNLIKEYTVVGKQIYRLREVWK